MPLSCREKTPDPFVSDPTGAQKPNAMVTQLGKELFDKIKAKAHDPGSQDKFQVPDYVDH